MTLAQACEYLQVSERKLRTMVTEKRLPGHKFGRDWRFSRAELDKWLLTQ